MRRAFLLPLLLAAGLAGCGDSGSELIPERTAARMIEQVDAVESAMSQDPPRCQDARNAARAGRRRAAALSSRVDDELKDNLVAWFEHLEDEARRECDRRQEPKETPTPSPTATEEPEETPEPSPTATEEPEEPEETPTAEPTAEPTVEPTVDPGVGEEE